MARVNQPLISQSARELRAKEKLLGHLGGAGKLLAWQIYDRFKFYLFDERRNNDFFSFPRSKILLITLATKSIPDKRIGNVSVNVECVESSIKRDREGGRIGWLFL